MATENLVSADKPEPPKHGWFSKKHKEYSGAAVYSTPEGGEVEVTLVRGTEDMGIYNWSDAEYVGLVGEFVRSVAFSTANDPKSSY